MDTIYEGSGPRRLNSVSEQIGPGSRRTSASSARPVKWLINDGDSMQDSCNTIESSTRDRSVNYLERPLFQSESVAHYGSRWLTIIDNLWAMFVLFPIMVSYWRGSWSLNTYYFGLEGHQRIPLYKSAALGSLYLITYLFLHKIEKALENTSKVTYVIVTRILFIYQGLLYMCLWRGFFGLFDLAFGPGDIEAWSALFTSLLLLILTGTLRTVLWAPFYVRLDTRPTLLSPRLRFTVGPEPDFMAFMADATISSLLIHPIAMIAWRSIYQLFNEHIYPKDDYNRYLTCLIFGICGTLTLFSLQGVLGKISKRLEAAGKPTLKLLYEDAVYLVVFCVMTPLWYGAWNLNVMFLITDTYVGGWVHHSIGTVGLLITQTYSYVASWGITRDGKHAGKGAFFPTQYFRAMLKNRGRSISCSIASPDHYDEYNDPNNDQNGIVQAARDTRD